MNKPRASGLIQGSSFSIKLALQLFVGGAVVAFVIIQGAYVMARAGYIPMYGPLMDRLTLVSNISLVAGIVLGLACMLPNYYRVDGRTGTVYIYWFGVIKVPFARKSQIAAVEFSEKPGPDMPQVPKLSLRFIGIRLTDGGYKLLAAMADPIQAESLAREVGELLGVSVSGLDKPAEGTVDGYLEHLPFFMHDPSIPENSVPENMARSRDRIDFQDLPDGCRIDIHSGVSPLEITFSKLDTVGGKAGCTGCLGFGLAAIAGMIAASYPVTHPHDPLIGFLFNRYFLAFALPAIVFIILLIRILARGRVIRFMVDADRLTIFAQGRKTVELSISSIDEMEPVYESSTMSRYSSDIRAFGYLAIKSGEQVCQISELEYPTLIKVDAKIRETLRRLKGREVTL